MRSTMGWQSRGKSLTLSSVALLEPSRPYFSLQPLPSTGAFRMSSRPKTFSAPAAVSRRLVRARLWMSQQSTVLA